MLWLYALGIVVGFIYFINRPNGEETPQEFIRIIAMLVIWPLTLIAFLVVKFINRNDRKVKHDA